MRTQVENLMQENNSILQQTSASRNEVFPIFYTVKRHSFPEFVKMCNLLQPRYFRISTRKEGINIIFGVTKKKAFFGRAETFPKAFRKLLADMQKRAEIEA